MDMMYLDRVSNTSNHQGQQNIGCDTSGNLQLDMILEIVRCVKEALDQLYCLGAIEILV